MGGDRRPRLTVGTKLFAVFAAMSALILSVVGGFEGYDRYFGNLLDTCARKLDIGSQVELATTEMQGAQRGLMLSYAMKDPDAAVQYIKLYGTSSEKIERLLTELRPLAATDGERTALEKISRNEATWKPKFQELRRVCQSGDIAAAYKLRNQNKLISAEMHAGATGLVEEQKAASVAARTDSRRISDSIAAVAALLILVLGGACATVVRSTSRQLRRSIADLEAGASQVTEAAVRIASSSRDVAQGASEQANALDQTTVSSREMAQATRENAAHSQQAAAFVNGLSRQVTDAVAILGGMITSMDEITASSGRISQIMRVVNEISFQTKLLALNAAVEAARAGESGAGFAVVAEEVRNLAQRTAQASNDTAELIENSILQSREGGAKLSQVAASVHAITESARKVKGLVDHVDASSTEQAEGIERISRAVACMEGVTHRTVSNARDSSQATDELQMQAECLMEVVARLRQMVGSGAEFGSAAKRIPDLAFTGR